MRYRGRGRPRLHKRKKDLGTKELQKKRAEFVTEELLDRYYRLGFITEEQHWCGNHFRWLYARRYGIPHVQAVDMSMASSAYKSHYAEDEWSVVLEVKYKEVEDILYKKDLLYDLLSLVAYSDGASGASQRPYSVKKVLTALEILVDLWC